jgi:hypothetical protein
MKKKTSKKYDKQVTPPYEIIKNENNFFLICRNQDEVKMLKKLLAHSEDGRDRESMLEINKINNAKSISQNNTPQTPSVMDTALMLDLESDPL